MKIITPFAPFFAAPIAGEKVALFAHCSQHLARLFQIVGLNATWDCIYSNHFGCHVAVATLERDDFTLLNWDIQEKFENGFPTTTFSKITNDKYTIVKQDLKELLAVRHVQIRISSFDHLTSSWQSHRTNNCYQIFGCCTGLCYDQKYVDVSFSISKGFINLDFILGRTKKPSDSTVGLSPQEVENIALLRRFLGSSQRNRQSCLANKALTYLIQNIGADNTLSEEEINPGMQVNYSISPSDLWSNDTTNLGFMARDNGAFGSLCLSDCYGEESTGQERCYYDD